jgi:hypothetical protein
MTFDDRAGRAAARLFVALVGVMMAACFGAGVVVGLAW